MNEPTRDELRLLRFALRALATRAGYTHPDSLAEFDEIALGLDAAFDCHLQRLEALEARCGELADELAEARDRLNDLDGQKRYNY